MRNFKVVYLLLSLSFLSLAASKPLKLAHYNVSKDKISVSGLSSGGFFAVQFHVAFSNDIMGAGIVAGGPYFCASFGISACLSQPALISVSGLVWTTYSTVYTLTIDNPSNMKNDRVFLFSGTMDNVVTPGVVKKLEEYYSWFVLNRIATKYDIPAAHAMVTGDYGHNCSHFGPPFINNCSYSTAYEILNHIYGDIKNANSSFAKEENLLSFDQSEFFGGIPAVSSVDTIGYVYVPTGCQDGHKECRLHIAFHGCQQGRMYLSTTYALHAGYNGPAEVNDIIILYPQVTSSTIPYNPKGCWDWWGYSAPSYASKIGPQMAGIKKMLNRIAYGL